MNQGMLTQIALMAVPAIMAITLHEAAHGYAALALGDDTARKLGRLSLNPLRHVDRMGTLLIPGFLIISQLLTIGRVEVLFGWAKPVPVDARRFGDPRRGMAIVAAAGPLMNFGLAFLTAALMQGGIGLKPDTWLSDGLFFFIFTNLVLGLFNLLPIPPLDGGRIAVWLLPLPLARVWARFERAGILVVLLAIAIVPRVTEGLGHRVDPVGSALGSVLPWAFDLVWRAAQRTDIFVGHV